MSDGRLGSDNFPTLPAGEAPLIAHRSPASTMAAKLHRNYWLAGTMEVKFTEVRLQGGVSSGLRPSCRRRIFTPPFL